MSGRNRLQYGAIDQLTDKNSYREFKDIADAEKWGYEKYSDWAQKYKYIYAKTNYYPEGSSLRLIEPASRYFGNCYQSINDYLRDNTSDECIPSIAFCINNLMIAIFSTTPINEKIILYRQVPTDMVKKLITLNKKDQPYCEKGFLSTSMIKSCCAETCGNEKYMLRIYVNNTNPIHAIYANVISKRDEEELLLPPGLYFRMINYPYKDIETGKMIFEVELVCMNI